MKPAIVLTTIRVPYLIEGYVDNLERHSHKDVDFIVIGDRHTPDKLVARFAEKIRERGYSCTYWDIEKQKKWMQEYPELDRIIPYNSDNRRNVGYLIAASMGSKVIVSIDDDNYVTSEDYIGQHEIVGTMQRLITVSSSSKWYNFCSLLKTKPDRVIYPRGFPYSKREGENVKTAYTSGRVVLNLGLWLGSPDVDAVTNLSGEITVTGLKEQKNIMLAPGTFSPINTQNTAFYCDILPCYYYIPMGVSISGMKIDRYGDIWSGLFAKKIIDHVNDRISIGHPLTLHKRNPHDFLKDLQAELWGMILTERLVSEIESIDFRQKTYAGAYLELAEELGDAEIYPNQTVRKFFKRIIHGMQTWVQVCERILR